MKNNIVTEEISKEEKHETNAFSTVNFYDSITHMNTLIGNFQKSAVDIESIFETLKDGKITPDLSFTHRDELINDLEKQKSNLEKLFEDYIQSLDKDIKKLDKRRIKSNVNVDIFNEYIPEEVPEETRITSSFFHKLKK